MFAKLKEFAKHENFSCLFEPPAGGMEDIMNLLGRGTEPEFWREVREDKNGCYKNLLEELHSHWNKYSENVPLYALKYSDFKLFFTTGSRSEYEKAYFARRLSLNCSALLSLIYPEEEKYIVRLMDDIYAICDSYTWCLPAHQPGLDKNNNSHVDLFASETAFDLAQIDALLGDRLEPLIRDRIRVETERRVVRSYLSRRYNWETFANNWNAVCTGSVAGTVMLLFPELFETLKPRFEASMEIYLSGFSADGFCYEGCGYWHYGFGFFLAFADMIEKFTDGEKNYFLRGDVKKISTFIQKMYLSGRASVSFADGGRTLLYHLGLLHYLKVRYPDDVAVYSPELSYNTDSCGCFTRHLRSFIWFDENTYIHPEPDDGCAQYYAPDAEWLVKRTPSYGFAVKGGCNAEDHNHNDVGSFIYAKNGSHVFTDPGSGRYTRQYFGKDTRYTILECSSRGHSVPIVNGKFQMPGAEYRASGVSFENGVFTEDIAGAYGIKELASLVRVFRFTDDDVTLTDTFDYSGEGGITERFVTFLKPEIGEKGTVVLGDTILHYDSKISHPVISSEMGTQNAEIYFVDFPLEKGTTEFTCRIS